MITEEDIKVGQRYKIELLCILNKEKVIVFETPTGDHIPLRNSDLECVSPTAPKYDPCRLFKKGDRVEPTFWNDRPPVASGLRANSEFLPHDGIYTVLSDERNSIAFIDYHGKSVFIPVNHLKLVTPVEELEPYSIFNDERLAAWTLLKNGLIFEYYPYRVNESDNIARSKEEAQAAAEAERDRLNAKYRKEKNND